MALPSGPPLPAAAQTALYMARPYSFLDGCSRRYGDIFTVKLLAFGEMVCTSHIDAIRQIFTGDPEDLREGEGNATLRPLIGERSILVMDGADHLAQRRALLPFFQGDRMRAYTEVIRDATLEVIHSLPRGRPINLHPVFLDLTLGVIFRTLFGIDRGPSLDELKKAFNRLFHETSPVVGGMLLVPTMQRDLGPLTPWATFKRDIERIDELLYREIERRRQPSAHRGMDVLSTLIASEGNEGERISDVELRDILFTLIVAGHDTTGTTLSWLFEAILSHPEVLARLNQELAAVASAGTLLPDHVQSLEYLEATVKESLRLHPVVPIIGVGRKLRVPMTVLGHKLPAGTKLVPNIYGTHRRPELYPEPERFNPERFLTTRYDPYTYLPFGGGVRRCLGMAFALHELKVILATALLAARFRRARRSPLRAVLYGVTIGPAGGARVIIDNAPRYRRAS